MKKVLGLDLGSNSIGWTVVENNELKDFGVSIFHPLMNEKTELSQISRYTKIITSRIILLTVLTIILTIISILDISNWQFWFNLTVASLITTITLLKK